MKVITKTAILWCLAVPALTATAQEQNAPSSTSQSEPAAAPPQTDQNSPNAKPEQQPSKTEEPQSQAQSPSPVQSQPQAAPLPATPSKPVLKRRKRKTSATHSQSGKVVVRNGGVKDDSVQLSAPMSKEQAQSSRENTAKLLASTDANLKGAANRQLSPAQQNMLDEIHTYVRQSKGAMDAGDLSRAHTLAYKALLLSGELAKK